ncbi:hypothetical protein QAD02_018216 [Eretmocerus hayati]|uniref:Uncharacterized protein n=1 Tax=Eretmocerus hayati TaxID=131215 RepID=A0ACC2PGI6_9HYME|nr:hypothetical protein QAD02_018216 [Eretmocerus hayati]
MIGLEESVVQYKFSEQTTILHEYEDTIASLKEELNACKLEQNRLRTEVVELQNANQAANEAMQQSVAQCNHGECGVSSDKEALTNLEKQITILQMEKDSITQLWQMSLKAIDVLEEDLKTAHTDDRNTKFYQEQVNSIKETYSEAIKMLETKLVAAKDNFFEQQVLWEQNKQKVEQLSREKNNIMEELRTCQNKTKEREKSHQEALDSLKETLNQTKDELRQIKQTKTDLEYKLRNAQHFANVMLSKDNEAKHKISEAVDLIESAVKERDACLQRETQLMEEKAKLENCMAKLSEEFRIRLETEISKTKEVYERNIRKYNSEMKELKAKLREQSTLLDRSQREYRLIEEEFEKIQRNSDNLAHRSNTRMSVSEPAFLEKELRSQMTIGSHDSICSERIQYLERQIYFLQEKLSTTSEKLRLVHLQNSRDIEDHLKEANDRTREIMEKCSCFEKQLSRALVEKESLASNLHSLEVSFEKETQRVNREKILLENRVRDLQDKVNSVGSTLKVSEAISSTILQSDSLQNLKDPDPLKTVSLLQEKYERKIKELIQHVEAHQKLSTKWKEEANMLTSKFHKRSQELKNKISALQIQNEELSRELLFYQKLITKCNTQIAESCSKDLDQR